MYNRLTDRDQSILNILAKRRVASRDQLIYLCGSDDRSQKNNIINKRLRILNSLGMIEKTQPYCPPGQGSYQQLVSLGKDGAKILGLKWRPYFKRTQDMVGNEMLEPPINWGHQLNLIDAEIAIKRKCAEVGQTVATLEFEETNRIGDLVPDIFTILVSGNTGRPLYIEVDRGTESYEYVKNKLQKYKTMLNSEEWKSSSWCKMFSAPPVPQIIIATTGGEIRLAQIEKMAEELNIRARCTSLRSLDSIVEAKNN